MSKDQWELALIWPLRGFNFISECPRFCVSVVGASLHFPRPLRQAGFAPIIGFFRQTEAPVQAEHSEFIVEPGRALPSGVSKILGAKPASFIVPNPFRCVRRHKSNKSTELSLVLLADRANLEWFPTFVHGHQVSHQFPGYCQRCPVSVSSP